MGSRYIRQHRYKLLGEPQIVRTMPWSTVISFRTSGDFVYLKCMAKEFAYEAALLEFLNKQKFLDLPNVIATNNVDGSFLMHDAGEPLRLTLTRNYDISIVCNALRSYAKLQIDCMNLTEPLIKRGASDWRLINLPQLFQKLATKYLYLRMIPILASNNHVKLHMLYRIDWSYNDALNYLKIRLWKRMGG